ncbi:MAG: TonB-dependent receptor [Bacteroides sp. SM23_62]|nr:MAG: TonB-dependent receptor [Bacteroides sp. SM23_62]
MQTAIVYGITDDAAGNISGKVIDYSNHEPMEFATVSVYTADSSLVTGNITSVDGTFNIQVPQGDYYIMVQFVSYQRQTVGNIRVTTESRQVDLGEIFLQQDTKMISEVTITGEKSDMVIGLDKRTFNVGKDLGNAGKSASEILDNIPSVTVDLDGNVSLRGSQNVQILVDGKPSGLISADNPAALKSLQGSMIDRVEVVTNPSARYEAEGMSGIINIVLKKDQQKGINGSFEVSAGYPHDYRAGANVNFRREKINYFLNYGVNYRERPGSGTAFQHFMYPDTNYYTDVESDRLRTGWSHNLRGGADYFINDRNTLTASAFIGLSDEKNKTNIWYRDLDQDGILQEVTWREDNEQELERNIEFSLDYTLKFEQKDRKLNVFAQYIEEGETEESDIRENITAYYGEALNDDPILQRALNKESQRNIIVQADYTHPFGENGKFETGYRGGLRFIDNPYAVEERNENGDWEYLEDYTNDFHYTENIHALYAQAGNQFNKWSLQLGLRSELSDVRTHLKQTDEKNDRLYFDLFPTLHTAYRFNDINSVQLSYSRRINRPHFWYLNPFNNYTDARNIRTGNPNLNPEYTDSYELGYLMNNAKTTLYAGGYFRHTDGVIERISEVDEEGITYIFPYNLSVQNSFGLETNLSVEPFSWWTLSGDINAFRAITSGEYKGERLESDDYSWNSRLNSMMRFENDMDIQTTFFYRAPQKTTQGERLAYYMLNLGISKDVLSGSGTLTLNIHDIFNTRKYRYIIDRPNFYSENEFRWSSRTISLSFVYRLNQLKKNSSRQNRDGFGGSDGVGI